MNKSKFVKAAIVAAALTLPLSVIANAPATSKNMNQLRDLVGCSVFAYNSNRLEYAQRAQDRIQAYPEEYKEIIMYYSGKAEGYLAGFTHASQAKFKSTPAKRLFLINANMLYKVNSCQDVIGDKL